MTCTREKDMDIESYVVNIGSSTRSEIERAKAIGKTVRYLEENYI